MLRPLQVFLCHASQDKPEVWKLHRYLKQRGAKPWLDQVDLLPGEDWEVEIPKALFSSDIILVCLSKNSVNKEGYVQKEIAFALDKALEKPEGTIFIIPVKLEDCELPKRLSRYQAVELFRTDGRKRLLMGLNKRVANLGDEVLPITVEDTKQKTPKPIKPKIVEEEKPAQTDETINEVKSSFVVEKKKEQAKPFTRILNPDSLNSQKLKQIKEDKQSNIFPRIFLWVAIFLGLLTVFMTGNLIFENFLLTPTSTPTTPSVTLKPLDSTPTATKSLAISTTTRFVIGSTTLGNDGMTMMYVPAGEFTMGSDGGESDEQPIHQVYLNAFWMDQTEITNEKYALCVDTGDCNTPREVDHYLNSRYVNHPIVYVTWEDARTYCEWAGRRLLTEAEWEKASKGTEGNLYPWGNSAPNSELLNYNNEIGGTTEVGNYPLGVSIYGALDMSGNVSEWVSSLYVPYPYDAQDGRENLLPLGSRAVRGGSWDFDFTHHTVRSADRYASIMTDTHSFVGFRCAMDADQ